MSSEGQVPLSLLGHLPIPRTNETGRRGSLGSGIIGGLLQFASPKFASPMSSMVNGFSAEYESIPDIHRTGNESAAKIHKLRNGPRKLICFKEIPPSSFSSDFLFLRFVFSILFNFLDFSFQLTSPGKEIKCVLGLSPACAI